MKKLYLFLLACLVTCVADAAKVYFQADTWTTVNAYAWGASGDVSQGWPGDPMTKNDATGLWEVEFSTTPENIIFNSNGAQTKDLKFKDGATYKQDGSIVGEDPEPPTPVSKELYLVGANYGNWQKDEAYKMTREDNVYTITLPEGLSGEWKIWNGTWDWSFGAGASQPVEGTATDVWFKSSNNFTLNTTGNTTVTFTLVEGSDVQGSSIPSTLLVETGEGPVPPVPVEKDLYLVGENYGNWDLDEAYKMTREDNVYTITLPEGLSGEWKIWDGTWDYTFGAGADQPVAGTPADAWFDSAANFSLNTTAKTTVTFTLVEGSDVKNSSIPSTLLVEVEEGPVPPVPVEKDLYLVGENYGNWALDEAYKMTREDNVYTITLPEGLSGDWKIWDGTWDYTFGAGADQPVAGSAVDAWFKSSANFSLNTTAKTKVTFTLVEGSDVQNSSIPSTLLVEVEEGPVPPVPVEKDLYLVGENYGTWALDEAYKMTREDNVYTITLPEGLSGEWKIWDGTWDYTFGAGADQPVAGTSADAWFNSAANFSLNTTAKTKVTFTLVEGSDVKNSAIPSTILVEVEEGPVPPVPVEKDLYLVGENYGNWDLDEAYKMTREDNVYTITLPEGLSGEWKIWDGTWDYTFGAGADQPVAGTATDAWFKSSANFSLSTTAKTTVTFTLVEGSDVENSSIPSTLLVEVEEGPVPPVPVDMPEHLYIVGNVNGASWDVTAPMELQKDGNTFRATGVTLTDAGAGSSYFTFITATGASWDEVNGSDRYGAPAQDTPATPNEATEVTKYTAGVNASAAQSWMISSSLEAIDIVVDFENMTMTVTRAAGIDSVTDGGMNIAVNGGVLSVEGASDVHVFTTGGALVSTSAKTALAPGLYIVVANGNAAKVMVK